MNELRNVCAKASMFPVRLGEYRGSLRVLDTSVRSKYDQYNAILSHAYDVVLVGSTILYWYFLRHLHDANTYYANEE